MYVSGGERFSVMLEEERKQRVRFTGIEIEVNDERHAM